VTVLEVIQKSAEFLAKKGVESPRLQAELLLAHVLKMPRMKLYLHFDRIVSAMELEALRALVKRRGQREPLQHIVGSTSFCGLEIAVNRHALVPRPETEILAELGWLFLSSHEAGAGKLQPSASPSGGMCTEDMKRHTSIALDFGTGSGCIAIALAAKCPTARIVALEVSVEALAVAQQNAARNGVAQRIQFVQGESFAALPSDDRFDLIISNPPYIPASEIASLQPEVRDYDPSAALDGGQDGLGFYRMFASSAAKWLRPDGKMMLEFGDGQADAVRRIFETQLWIVEAIKQDYSQRPRILIARRK
jgi:release factor glutamine methyltransferase